MFVSIVNMLLREKMHNKFDSYEVRMQVLVPTVLSVKGNHLNN
jgi:hypothetical protein